MTTATVARLDARSRDLRIAIIDALEGGRRGHVGSALSVVEIVRVLYDDVLRVRPAEPDWPDRDRLILSKGHGSLGLYVVLADAGFFPREELLRQCRADALLGGHPEVHIPGIEASTGALGHGLPLAVGMALASRMRGRPSRTFAILGDGELGEGSNWEAAMIGAKHGLRDLTVVVDYNKMQSYGTVADVQPLEPLAEKWHAFGWAVTEVDGHDVAALRATFARLPLAGDRPSVVIAHTVKGRGLPEAEHNAAWHHKASFSPEAAGALRRAIAEAP
jgi:transketolase